MSAIDAADRITGRACCRGFNIIELMVGLTLSLLIALAALAASQMMMAGQRQGSGTAAAFTELQAAMATLQYEVAQAGLGFFADGAPACASVNVSAGARNLRTAAALPPVFVQGSGKTNDQLDVLYAQSPLASASVQIAAAASSDAAALSLQSYLPVSAGQALLLIPPQAQGLPCSFRTVTSVDAHGAGAGAGAGPSLALDTSGLHNQGRFPAVAYSDTTRVALFGQLIWTHFEVSPGGDLLMSRPIDDTQAVLARHVAGFVVEPGVSDSAQAPLSRWIVANGAPWNTPGPAELAQLDALRISILVQSAARERPDAQGRCQATTIAPTLAGRQPLLPPDWQCYRYRSNSITVPLRNFMLGFAS